MQAQLSTLGHSPAWPTGCLGVGEGWVLLPIMGFSCPLPAVAMGHIAHLSPGAAAEMSLNTFYRVLALMSVLQKAKHG